MAVCTRPYIPSYTFNDTDEQKIKGKRRAEAIYKIQGTLEGYYYPCGKCESCLENRVNMWSVRSMQEASYHQYSNFCTFTYSNDNLPVNQEGYSTLLKDDIKNLFKRIRKSGIFVKYIMCGEYGSKDARPHYHVIFFGMDYTEDVRLQLEQIWQKGFVNIKPLIPQRIRYLLRYLNKKSDKPLHFSQVREYFIPSKGIGKQWLFDNYKNVIDNKYKMLFNGTELSLPRYYIKLLEKHFNIDYIEILRHTAKQYDEKSLMAMRNGFANSKIIKRKAIEDHQKTLAAYYGR